MAYIIYDTRYMSSGNAIYRSNQHKGLKINKISNFPVNIKIQCIRRFKCLMSLNKG